MFQLRAVRFIALQSITEDVVILFRMVGMERWIDECILHWEGFKVKKNLKVWKKKIIKNVVFWFKSTQFTIKALKNVKEMYRLTLIYNGNKKW